MALIGTMKYLTIGNQTYEIAGDELQIASASTLGGIKVGSGLSINSTTGVLSASITESDPVFAASAAAGITSTDISNWNAKISDDKTWNGVGLATNAYYTTSSYYVPAKGNTELSGTAGWITTTPTPTAYAIARYDNSAYLKSTTPSANDNSTKVATTAYVNAAIPDVSGKLDKTTTNQGVTRTINDSTGGFILTTLDNSNHGTMLQMNDLEFGLYDYTHGLADIITYNVTNEALSIHKLTTPTNNTDAATKKYVDDAIAAGGDIFVAIVGTTTYADVLAAYNAGKTIVAKEDYNSTYYYYYFERYESNIFYFGTPGHVSNNGQTKSLYMYTLDSSNTWSDSHIYLNIPIISLNGISNVPAASFYAPTTAGTSGQVLTSNGSGAPTWAAAPSGSSTQIIRWTES